MSTGTTKLDVVVSDIVPVNELVTRFHFRPAGGGRLPTFSGGAHVVVEMREDGKPPRLNPYSLMSSPLDTSEYTISVRRDDAGRGGSLFMHGRVRPGDRMVVSYPVNLFSLDLRAKKHLMIAGGIGITPFMAQTAQLAAEGGNFELHYACRTASLFTYGDVLAGALRPPHPPLPRRSRREDRARPPAVVAAARHASLHLRPRADDRLGAPHRRRARLAVRKRPLRAFFRAAARQALRRHARPLRQDHPCRRAAEPARGHRGGRRRPALSVPWRRLRPVRNQCYFLGRQIPAQRPLAVGRGPRLGQEDHALRVALRGQSLVLER